MQCACKMSGNTVTDICDAHMRMIREASNRVVRTAVAAAVSTAVQKEREACARIADKWATDLQRSEGAGGPAAEICARSNT